MQLELYEAQLMPSFNDCDGILVLDGKNVACAPEIAAEAAYLALRVQLN
jgi:hypothetical protein